ncbi:phage tail protein I [Sphingomonas sp. LT1P40]|uniref:phage tail protein I n=1 Tax=Alteristakelama amylovorans TaxID=3096166 RepID=UPI002FCA8DE7
MTDLLPPGSTNLERALSRVGARIGDMPVDVATLWNPATCPIDLLPWLAWTLSIDRWNADWSDAEKRAAVADAIAVQRRKGTRLAVEQVLESFCSLLELVEWFEATPQLDPYTFEVRLPLIGPDGAAGGERVTAAFARQIIADVTRAKPVRAHFTLVQQLDLIGLPAPIGTINTTAYRRLDAAATDSPAGFDPEIEWGALLQDENGEPLQDDTGGFIDGTAP